MTLQFVDGNKSLQNIIRIISISCSFLEISPHLAISTTTRNKQITSTTSTTSTHHPSFPNKHPQPVPVNLPFMSGMTLPTASVAVKHRQIIDIFLVKGETYHFVAFKNQTQRWNLLILKSIQNGISCGKGEGFTIIHFGFRPILGNSNHPPWLLPWRMGWCSGRHIVLLSSPVPPIGVAGESPKGTP